MKHGGPQIPSRLDAVDAPHIKRCLAAGLVEVTGGKAHLTPAGRVAVADRLVSDIARESAGEQVGTSPGPVLGGCPRVGAEEGHRRARGEGPATRGHAREGQLIAGAVTTAVFLAITATHSRIVLSWISSTLRIPPSGSR